MFSKLHLVDTLAAMMLPWLTSAFGVFLMRQFFSPCAGTRRGPPCSTVCSPVRRLLASHPPLAKPALATLAIFTLLGSWNDLIWPLIVNNNPANYDPARPGQLPGQHRTQWSMLMWPAMSWPPLPLIIFFLIAETFVAI